MSFLKTNKTSNLIRTIVIFLMILSIVNLLALFINSRSRNLENETKEEMMNINYYYASQGLFSEKVKKEEEEKEVFIDNMMKENNGFNKNLFDKSKILVYVHFWKNERLEALKKSWFGELTNNCTNVDTMSFTSNVKIKDQIDWFYKDCDKCNVEKLFATLKKLYSVPEDEMYDWYYKNDDDAYVFIERWKEFLNDYLIPEYKDEPVMIGYPHARKSLIGKVNFICGPGYFYNKAALMKLKNCTNIEGTSVLPKGYKFAQRSEDTRISLLMQECGVRVIYTFNSSCYPPEQYIKFKELEKFKSVSYTHEGFPISYHYIPPEEIEANVFGKLEIPKIVYLFPPFNESELDTNYEVKIIRNFDDIKRITMKNYHEWTEEYNENEKKELFPLLRLMGVNNGGISFLNDFPQEEIEEIKFDRISEYIETFYNEDKRLIVYCDEDNDYVRFIMTIYRSEIIPLLLRNMIFEEKDSFLTRNLTCTDFNKFVIDRYPMRHIGKHFYRLSDEEYEYLFLE